MLSRAASADVLCREPPAQQGHDHLPQGWSSVSTSSARDCVVAFPSSSGFSHSGEPSSQRLDQRTKTSCEKKSHSAPEMVTQDQDALTKTSCANATVNMSHSCEARPREESVGMLQPEELRQKDDIFSCTGTSRCSSNRNSRFSSSCRPQDNCCRRGETASARCSSSTSSATLVEQGEASVDGLSVRPCTSTSRGLGGLGQEGGAAASVRNQSREEHGLEEVSGSYFCQQRKMQQETSQQQHLQHVPGMRIQSATGSPVVSTTLKSSRPSSCSDSRSLFKSTLWSRLEGPLKRLFLPVRKYNNLIRQKNEAKETSRSRTQGASTVSASSMQDKEKTKSTRKNSFSTGATFLSDGLS